MRKFVSLSVLVILGLSGSIPAQAVDEALFDSKEITVANVDGYNVREPKVFSTKTGSVLVSWVEEIQNKNWLKAKVVRTNDTQTQTVSVNKVPATNNMDLGLLPKIVGNDSNQYFAVWAMKSVIEGKLNQRIVGTTSTGGLQWSDPFVIVPNTEFSGDIEECSFDPFRNDCGFGMLNAAIDDKGRLAVLVSRKSGEYSSSIWAAATSSRFSWPELNRLGSVWQLRDMNIVGLDNGFATSYMNYSKASSCAVYVNFFGWGKQEWSDTLRATFRSANTVIRSQWVQRDENTLSLAMASEITAGGVFIRNFNPNTLKWVGLSQQIEPAKEKLVYQNITAEAYGDDFAIGYVTYNQETGISTAKLATQSGPTGTFKISSVTALNDQINPLMVAATKNMTPVFAYQALGLGARVTKGLSGSSKKIPLFKESTWLGSTALDTSDTLFNFSIKGDGGKYQLGLVKGKLN